MIKFSLSKIEVFYILLFAILTMVYFISTINKLTYENENLCKKLVYILKIKGLEESGDINAIKPPTQHPPQSNPTLK